MVAYSFQKRFCDDVANLVKRQTIRANRKRHARVGEPVQLFYGMRTKHCRKLVSPDPICIGVTPIVIWLNGDVSPAMMQLRGTTDLVSDVFAKQDGFRDASDFSGFWFDTHGPGRFDGVLIDWRPAEAISE